MSGLSKTAQAAIILCLVLLVRIPFLNQAIQGDDFYYLKAAEHAQIDPLHPNHARYVFLGDMVDMRGHPHPPLNAWFLALLIWGIREVREIPFHAAYILFSVIAAFSAWVIASSLGRKPLLATALFIVTPAFVVNGNSLEADLPFVAFWLGAIAAFLHGRWWIAGILSILAALTAYQAVVLTPILAWWLILNRNRTKGAWVAALSGPFTVAVWQLFERLTSGALPAAVLAGYMQSYNLQAFAQKLRNAGALTGHLAWLVFPALAITRWSWWTAAVGIAGAAAVAIASPNPLFVLSFGLGTMLLLKLGQECLLAHGSGALGRRFLSGWILIFFCSALTIFFAGSVRYLLPMVLPLAILVSDRWNTRWIVGCAVAQAVLSFGLAIVNYQHWDMYRDFARTLEPELATHRAWTNAEWGMRHYLEAGGAAPIEKGREFWPGDLIVTSAYSPQPAAGPAAVVAERTLTSAIPLRIVGLGADSAYSSISFGLAPFAISQAPLDHVRALIVAERRAEQSMLEIGSTAAASQIVSGIYNHDRWVARRGTVLLNRPESAVQIEAKIFIPPQAPARVVKLYVDSKMIYETRLGGPGAYTITAPAAGLNPATATIEFDQTFSVPPDQRELGAVLLSIGFR